MNFCLRSEVFPSDSLCNSITLPGPVKVMNKITTNDSNSSFPIFSNIYGDRNSIIRISLSLLLEQPFMGGLGLLAIKQQFHFGSSTLYMENNHALSTGQIVWCFYHSKNSDVNCSEMLKKNLIGINYVINQLNSRVNF